MNLIKQENLDREIVKKYLSDFILENDGLYLIEIIASAKSWWQNLKSLKLRSLFKDDDITLILDRLEITTATSNDIDARAIWNGNELKGLLKTVLIVINLKKGKHILSLVPNQNPYLKSITVSRLDQPNKITYTPTDNNPAQAGHGRPWLSFVSINLAVQNLTISAKANKRRDDDDLKLIIDGEIKKNEVKNSHKDWYWCGKISKGEEKKFTKQVSWNGGLHYFDLWADESPFLYNIELALADNSKSRIPTIDDPEWTGDFNDDSEQMILARAIFGEVRSLPEKGRIAVGWVIRNRIGGRDWGKNYHEVILHRQHFSAFNPTDPNLPYVRNPFLDRTQITDWYECYKIAGQVISGEVSDPTGGANHYFSDFKNPPYWTKNKNAHLKLKIDNTLFYEVKSSGKAGFVKIKILLIIFVSAIILVFAGAYFAININDKLSCERESDSRSYDVQNYRHYYINPVTEEVEVIHLDSQGKFLATQNITNDGYAKSQVSGFSYTEMFGYFANLHKKDEIFDYTDSEARDEYYRNYVALMVQRREYGDPEEVFRGDILTSSWKWKDRSHVIVYNDCGLNCLLPYEIDINTGRAVSGAPSLKNEKIIDILDAPLDKVMVGEYQESYFTANGAKQRVVYKEKGIDHLKISPDKRKVGFLYESGGYYEPCHKISLTIMNIQDQEIKNVFESDCKISKWEWVNSRQAAVYKNCGTECQSLHLLDSSSGEENTLQYGVDYAWSPDKKLVLAYHYAGQYGITVGDKSGNELLTISRDRFSADNGGLVEATKAAWSPDSAKLALAIKKEKEDKMEFFVYNVKDNFKKIYQAVVLYTGDIPKISWSDDGKKVYYGKLAANFND